MLFTRDLAFKCRNQRRWRMVLLLIVLLGGGFSATAWAQAWDPNSYIDVDEVRPGMEAYCLTVYQGTAIERFDLDVVDVVRGFQPGLDVILVQGTDARFLHTGPVAGCSGSPVYIAGRLAGALAFGWPLSKDPLYGVTPIRAMLGVGQTAMPADPSPATGFLWDYREPLDFNDLGRRLVAQPLLSSTRPDYTLDCPLLCSGLSTPGQRFAAESLAACGFVPVAAGTGLGQAGGEQALSFEPGGVIMVPLVDGDIRLAVLGTVTEVLPDRLLGFGHSFLGQGPVEFPLATGTVHTIVSNLSRSFKLGSAIQTVGALVYDEPVGVVGVLGQKAPTIPVHLQLDHYRRPQSVTYACQVAEHRLLTPELLKALIGGAVAGLGTLPPDHTVRYEASITLGADRTLRWANTSAGTDTREMLMEVLGVVALLLNNPFGAVELQNIDIKANLTPVNSTVFLTAIEVPDRRVKPGATIQMFATLESYRADKQRHALQLTLPPDVKPGKYKMTVGGSYDYQRMLRRRAPHKLMAHDLPSLLDALDFALSHKRDRLYAILELPSKGIALERQEMPGLPPTRALVLRSAKRTVSWNPLLPWLETFLPLEAVVANGQQLTIEVESYGAKP